VHWPDQKERFQRLKEAVLLMKQLWSDERVSYEGNYFHTENATVYDRPEGGVPLYIAASGPAAARLAGRLADGFITTSGKAPELYADKLLPAVREGAEKEGRSMDEIELTIEMKVSFDTDHARAMEDTRNWGALALTPEEKVGVEDPIEMQRLADALPAERAASRWIVSDNPEDQVSAIRPYLDLGFTHLNFHFPGEDQERALRLYAERVLPLLREP
jgi:coenzyme F420-dependent glucose-6-phosphate dehydrogenase